MAGFSQQSATLAKLAHLKRITQTGGHRNPFAAHPGYLLCAATTRSCIAVSHSTLPVDFRLGSKVISKLGRCISPKRFRPANFNLRCSSFPKHQGPLPVQALRHLLGFIDGNAAHKPFNLQHYPYAPNKRFERMVYTGLRLATPSLTLYEPPLNLVLGGRATTTEILWISKDC